MRWLAHIDPSVQKISGWITFIAGVGAFLSWVASHIAPLSPYGWGAFVFAGLAAACVLSLVLSLGLIAWRFFKPLSPTTVPIDASNSAPWKADIDSTALVIEKYIDETSAALRQVLDDRFRLISTDVDNKIADNIRANARSVVDGFRELASKIDAINVDIGRLNELGVSQHGINDDLRGKVSHQAGAQAVILADLRNLERKFGYLVDAINARDAETQIKQADVVVDHLGRKLLTATGYSDPKAWLADYRSWHDSITAIDRTILNQKVEGFTPYLDIRARDLQKCSETPPTEGLRADDSVIVAYKTVFLAQKRYTLGREQVFRFFAAKGAFPG